MNRASTRIFLGCVAGALSVLVFHQTTLQVFFWLGLAPQAAFRIAQVPPFNAPLVVSITFWGAIYGALFGALLPLVRGPLWLKGVGAGLCVMLVAWFVFLPLMALVMTLLYWFPRRYYVEHLVFFLHNHAALYLAMSLEILLRALAEGAHAAWMIARR